jgi:hypothetical protein
MPAGVVLEAVANILVEFLGVVFEHVLQAPGYLFLRFVLRRPSDRVAYDSAATALAGVLVWGVVAVSVLLLLRSR